MVWISCGFVAHQSRYNLDQGLQCEQGPMTILQIGVPDPDHVAQPGRDGMRSLGFWVTQAGFMVSWLLLHQQCEIKLNNPVSGSWFLNLRREKGQFCGSAPRRGAGATECFCP